MRVKTLAYGVLTASALALAWPIASAAPPGHDARLEGADPTDPAARVPPTVYNAGRLGADPAHSTRTDIERLPWRRLFDPDGRFARHPVGAAADSRPEDARAAASPPSPPKAILEVGAGSDARGVIREIDRTQGKVKLQHGPIQRLEMPGMTMIFRVKDAALLEQVKEGEEVGFTLEVDGGTFYVTGFQK